MNEQNLQYTVYIDVLFYKNLILSVILLLSAGLWQKVKIKWRRVILSAFFWSVGVVLCLFLPVPFRFIGNLILQGLLCLGIFSFLYGIKSLKGCIPMMMTLMVVSFYYSGSFGAFRHLQNIFHSFGGKIIVLFAVFGLFLMAVKKSREKMYYKVRFPYGESILEVTALLDSGNSLREPITGKAVCILEKDCLPNEVIGKGIWMIPYRAVGVEQGMLRGIRVNNVELETGLQKIQCEEMLLGLYEGKLSVAGKYQMLLHGEYLGREVFHD